MWTVRGVRLPGWLGTTTSLLAMLGLLACFASSAAVAVVPKANETLPNGSVVEGKCETRFSGVGNATVEGEQWTLSTDDPQRLHAAPGEMLAPVTMPLENSLVPYGDFQLAREAIGEHSHLFPIYDYEHHLIDPRFSAQWGWHYGIARENPSPGETVKEWARNFEGGSEASFQGLLEGHPYTRQSKRCSEQVAEDTSGDTPVNDHRHPPLGSYAGAFPGESVSQGHGLAVQRPGPYALDQWTLNIHYKRVAKAEFEAHPFWPTNCPGGTSLLNSNPETTEEMEASSFYLHGAEADYRVHGPEPEGMFEWEAETYCVEGSTTPFIVTGAKGPGNYPGDMSQWPTSPYINQYAAGSRSGLPGAATSGPASLLMGMRASLGDAAPASSYPNLSAAYAQTVDGSGEFEFVPAVNLLKELGWPNAVTTQLGSDPASVSDADPPDPLLVDPNATNEGKIDKALRTGPVVLETALGTNEWGLEGAAHVVLIVGIDPQQPGSYIVDDPAGNYFSSPTGHYMSNSYGYSVDYPKGWVLAYATGRGMIEVGSPASNAAPPAPVSTETKTSATTTSTSGSPGTSDVAGKTATHFSAAQIRTLLKGAIVPSGKSAHIASLKKHLGFALSFHAPEAGVVTINWYELPRGASLTIKTKPRPLLVARGQLSFAAAGTRLVAMHLTMAGAHLLKHAHHLALTASGSFTPRGGASIDTTRAFVLK